MADHVARLHEKLTDAGIPVDSVILAAGVFSARYKAEATAQQITDGNAIVAAYNPSGEDSADDTLRQRIRATAQSAVGIQFDQLTNVQLRALLAILLNKEQALNQDGSVRPLAKWAKD